MNGSQKDGLYGALENALKQADEALDCASLFDIPEVREHATSVNRVSDYLGNMWRRGDVIRLPAPRMENSKARWVYAWKGRTQARIKLKDIAAHAASVSDKVRTLVSQPALEIVEDGRTVTITLPHLTITIQQRS